MKVSCRLFGLCAAAIGLVALGEGVGAVAAPSNTLTREELDQGWILLFDGETLFGWTAGGKADWHVSDGAIRVAKGEPDLLATTSQFADFALKAEFRSPKGTNSGIFLRTASAAMPTDVATACYELNIADPDHPYPTGSFVKRKRRQADPDGAGWQALEVTAEGGRFQVKLNGQPVLDYTDPNPVGRGFLGLQYNQGPVEFRNLKLKPLGLASIFNGKDLSGWRTFPGQKTVCSVTPEGWLRVKDGRGQLETLGQYADFTLQLEVFVNGKGINSGIFFRSIPGEMMNGYESQIHNGFLDGDRGKPVDCGTGGIFRRQNARKVVADDQQWFHKTIHVEGDHMAVWVNGYQVSDWTDTRPPNDNPRKGLRRQAGTIIIQGHDPTTDFLFRNLKAGELPRR